LAGPASQYFSFASHAIEYDPYGCKEHALEVSDYSNDFYNRKTAAVPTSGIVYNEGSAKAMPLSLTMRRGFT
jgi:hypothetical protein